MALVALVTACNAAVAVAVVAKLCASPLEHPLNAAQASVALAYVVALLTWLEAELALLTGLRTSFSPVRSGELASVLDAEEEADDSRSLDDDQPASRSSPAPISETAMRALRAAAELSALMVLLYICDRTTLVGRGPKHASKLEFWGVFSLLCLASLLGARRTHEAADAEVKPLQREQTEEWKGWMQVMFLLYHYWMATEMYNAIRIYIAAYIWMTGFGNFSYYYTKGDFAMPRFVQMMWRLNFLVAFVCLTLNNEYMLYYICPLHTLFTIMVYATLRLGSAHNQSSPRFLLGKLCGALLVSCLLWDVPGTFDALSAPFTPLLRYSGDLFQSTRPPLHEWHFRSSLDHLVWIFGMGVAYAFPAADRWLNRLDTDAGSNPLLRCARGGARRGAPRAQCRARRSQPRAPLACLQMGVDCRGGCALCRLGLLRGRAPQVRVQRAAPVHLLHPDRLLHLLAQLHALAARARAARVGRDRQVHARDVYLPVPHLDAHHWRERKPKVSARARARLLLAQLRRRLRALPVRVRPPLQGDGRAQGRVRAQQLRGHREEPEPDRRRGRRLLCRGLRDALRLFPAAQRRRRMTRLVKSVSIKYIHGSRGSAV